MLICAFVRLRSLWRWCWYRLGMTRSVIDSSIDRLNGFRYPHLPELIRTRQITVREPRAFARLPLATAYHAELCQTSTGHMIAALLELDHRAAVEAPLPPFLLRLVDELGGFRVIWAVLRSMHLVVAECADLGLASGAVRILSSLNVAMDVGRLDPFAAFRSWAVDAVLGVVLLVLPVPESLELERIACRRASRGYGRRCSIAAACALGR